MYALFRVIFKSFAKSCLVDTYRLIAEVLYYILAHVSRYASDLHEVKVEVTFRMLYAADANLVTIHESEHMELLVLCILLADFLKFETAE